MVSRTGGFDWPTTEYEFGSPGHLRWSYKILQEFRSQELEWTADWGDERAYRAQHQFGEFRLFESEHSIDALELKYHWREGGWRTLGHGTAAALRQQAQRLVQRGGPFGGPSDWVNKKQTITPWRRSSKPDQAYVREIFEGMQFRIRGEHINVGLMTLVDRSGSFAVFPGGSMLNLASQSVGYQYDHEHPEDPTKPMQGAFSVRVSGASERLRHTTVPGLLGYLPLENNEVVLQQISVQRGALVAIQADSRYKVLAEGYFANLLDVEVAEAGGSIPRFGESARLRPASWSVEPVIDGLRNVPGLHRVVRRHLEHLFRKTATMESSRALRQIVWAFALANADGCRTTEAAPSAALLKQLVEWGYLDREPSERSRQGAMRLLDKFTPLVSRTRKGARRWIVHYPDFLKPSRDARACFAQLRQTQ